LSSRKHIKTKIEYYDIDAISVKIMIKACINKDELESNKLLDRLLEAICLK
jgi:hypothetical protein